MEVNVVVVMPLLSIRGAEAVVKYFVIQAFSGGIILVCLIYSFRNFILLRLVLKIGVAPFHYWVPQVFKSSSWGMVLLLSTWQKLLPFALIGCLGVNYYVIEGLVVINALVGGLGGVIQTSLRSLMAYSSIAHSAWFFAALWRKWELILYIVVYFISLLIVIFPFIKFSGERRRSSLRRVGLGVSILSLGGFPPLLGFVPKWQVFRVVDRPVVILVLVLGRVLSLSYYLLLFCHIMLVSPQIKSVDYFIVGLVLRGFLWLFV